MQFGMVDRMATWTGQVVGYGDRSKGRGSFGAKCGVPHCKQWGVCSIVAPSHNTLRFLVIVVGGELIFAANAVSSVDQGRGSHDQ